MGAVWNRVLYQMKELLKEENEIRLLDLMAGVLMGLAPVVHIIIVKKISVPYGRYTNPSWGPQINAKLAWFIQVGGMIIIEGIH